MQLDVNLIKFARGDSISEPETHEFGEKWAWDGAERGGVGLVDGVEGVWYEGESGIEG